MKYTVVLLFGLMFILLSCSTETKQKTITEAKKDSVIVPETDYKKSDNYLQRVMAFRTMPDKTIEELVTKYEAFAVLFAEFQDIDKHSNLYSPQEQKDNKEASITLNDQLIDIKSKLGKNISAINKEQEKRLDAADAEMNKYIPNVYRQDSTQAN